MRTGETEGRHDWDEGARSTTTLDTERNTNTREDGTIGSTKWWEGGSGKVFVWELIVRGQWNEG